MTLTWKDVCKFLSGAFFVSTGVLFYLYIAGTPVQLVGTQLSVTPGVNGIRAVIHLALFLLFSYLGFVRK
jgi:uncharacterized protein (DUF486 family)